MLKASDGLNVAFEKGHTDCRASFGQEKLGQKTQLHIQIYYGALNGLNSALHIYVLDFSSPENQTVSCSKNEEKLGHLSYIALDLFVVCAPNVRTIMYGKQR